MAYKFNWKSDKISANDAQSDDGGTHLAVIAERDEEGNDPYHKPILNQFMGWRMVWFMMPHGYLDGYGDESE